MNFIRVTLLLICCAFLTGCGENPLTFPVETITTTRNTEEETEKMDTSDTKTDEVVEFFDNYADLLDFLGLDFTGMEISSINCENIGRTRSCVVFFLNGSEDSFRSNESNSFGTSKLESMLTPTHLKWLEGWGINANDIKATGSSYMDYEVEYDERYDDWWTDSLERYWYLLDNSGNSYEGNIYLRALIPFAVEIDVEKIISEQGE